MLYVHRASLIAKDSTHHLHYQHCGLMHRNLHRQYRRYYPVHAVLVPHFHKTDNLLHQTCGLPVDSRATQCHRTILGQFVIRSANNEYRTAVKSWHDDRLNINTHQQAMGQTVTDPYRTEMHDQG